MRKIDDKSQKEIFFPLPLSTRFGGYICYYLENREKCFLPIRSVRKKPEHGLPRKTHMPLTLILQKRKGY